MNLYLFAIREDARHPLNIILIFLLPIPVLFIPANPGSYPFGLSLYGMIIVYSSFLLSRPLVEDRMKGIAVRIAASPISSLCYLANHLLGYLTLLVVQIFILLLGSLIIHGDAVSGRVVLFTLYLTFGVMSLSMALAWNVLFKSYNLSFGIFSGVASILCLLSGVSLPLFLLPDQLIRYIMFLPTYWLPFGLEAWHGGNTMQLIQAQAILLGYAGIFLLIGSKRRL
jgi:ABC-2 type transport system permease protein